ncbi:MAG: hypothetical protein P1U42_04420 [Phycisphaerales bacterium]|nr:hypothetical protein [Phycisphaerales bacterium]
MVVLRPSEVKFGSQVWENVARVSVDRVAVSTVDGWDDFGSHLVFVDVARQRVVIRVTQEIVGDDFDGLALSELEEFSFVGSNGTDARRVKVKADVVVESVLNKVSDFGSSRVITLVAVSEDGSEDPITVS